MKYFLYLIALSISLISCNRKPSSCAAYREVSTVAIPEEGYQPINFIITERQTKTGLVKKVDKVSKKRHKTRAQFSKLIRKEKKFIKDKDLFPEVTNNSGKRPKAKKMKKTTQNPPEEEKAPAEENQNENPKQ